MGTISWVVLTLIIGGALHFAWAAHDKLDVKLLADREEVGKKERHRKQYRHRGRHDEKRYLVPAQNPTHTKKCGACHLPYSPNLLPARSWDKIFTQIETHFGESLDLDPDAVKTILSYLQANSADRSQSELATKIMRSVGADTPTRITEIPYIQAKHRRVSPDILMRETIGSLSNCKACHGFSEKGVFNERVRIPG